MKFGVKAILGVGCLCVLVLIFQNCSNSQFSSGSGKNGKSTITSTGENETGVPDPSGTPTGPTDPNQCTPNGIPLQVTAQRVDPADGLVEISSNCTAGATVHAESSIYKGSAKCANNNKVVVCSLLGNLGTNAVKLSQQAPTCGVPDGLNVNITPFTGNPVTPEPPLEVTDADVVDPSKGTVDIDCEPGSSIQGTIYGNEAANATCPMNGTLRVNLNLVPSLAGTGQRVVYLNQTTQSGRKNSVFLDMDNVDKTHNCTIGATQANTNYCVASAGSITGFCKAGTPVQVLVNGKAQRVVDCKENGTYVAQNVLLPAPGQMNKIQIKQKTPFNSTCDVSKTITAF